MLNPSKILKDLMASKNINQAELARRMKLSPVTVSVMLKESTKLSVERFERAVNAIGYELDTTLVQCTGNQLAIAIKETREHMEINGNPDATDEDAIEELMDECGQTADGSCTSAGSEYCSFECPFGS